MAGLNIIGLAMTLLRHRESIAKIVAVLPELKTIFSALQQPPEQPEQPPPLQTQSQYPVGSMSWLQDSLNEVASAGLEVDGEYGPATNKAVREYQTENGLVADGWAGPETISAIISDLEKAQV